MMIANALRQPLSLRDLRIVRTGGGRVPARVGIQHRLAGTNDSQDAFSRLGDKISCHLDAQMPHFAGQ